jgi:hypothetical protein
MGIEAYVLPEGILAVKKYEFQPYVFSEGEIKHLMSESVAHSHGHFDLIVDCFRAGIADAQLHRCDNIVSTTTDLPVDRNHLRYATAACPTRPVVKQREGICNNIRLPSKHISDFLDMFYFLLWRTVRHSCGIRGSRQPVPLAASPASA